jgi:predicted nucleotidyltransferase component of viral defense system
MTPGTHGLSRSVHTRLLNHARTTGVDANLVLNRYATERFLYRLSSSPHADRFILKGGLLLLAWLGETVRPTRDADLLGIGDLTDEILIGMLRDVCELQMEPDAMEYLRDSIRVAPIRDEDAYGGRRATLDARLGSARLRVQVDVGFGDAVMPPPEWLDYPSLLDLPHPRLRAYRPETVIAEKVHAMVTLGVNNSRMRDFFDVYVLSQSLSFEGQTLVEALRATFERRHTPIGEMHITALMEAFGLAEGKNAPWRAFLTKSDITSAPGNFSEVCSRIDSFLRPVQAAMASGASLSDSWRSGGPWKGIL